MQQQQQQQPADIYECRKHHLKKLAISFTVVVSSDHSFDFRPHAGLMTSQAPVVWWLAIVVAGLLQLSAATNVDHHAGQLLTSSDGSSRLRCLLSISNGSKVGQTPVCIEQL